MGVDNSSRIWSTPTSDTDTSVFQNRPSGRAAARSREGPPGKRPAQGKGRDASHVDRTPPDFRIALAIRHRLRPPWAAPPRPSPQPDRPPTCREGGQEGDAPSHGLAPVASPQPSRLTLTPADRSLTDLPFGREAASLPVAADECSDAARIGAPCSAPRHARSREAVTRGESRAAVTRRATRRSRPSNRERLDGERGPQCQ